MMSASAMDHRKNNFKGKANFSAQEVSQTLVFHRPRDQFGALATYLIISIHRVLHPNTSEQY
jgi:hypothetical protein